MCTSPSEAMNGCERHVFAMRESSRHEIVLLHTFGVPRYRVRGPRVASRGGAAFLTLGFGV